VIDLVDKNIAQGILPVLALAGIAGAHNEARTSTW
jgi:hypothetical protein